MPRYKRPPRLEEICLESFSSICACACTRLENENVIQNESKFIHLITRLPGTLLEVVVPSVIKIIAAAVRKNRSKKGLLKALECLPQKSLKRLDIGALFSEVRLYGQVNTQCKVLLKTCLQRLPMLTHLNLESKCNNEMLYELAKHCPSLEDLHVPQSDITDRGLLALCGISVGESLLPNEGCFKLARISVLNCMNITMTGVASLLRNLPSLINLSYDKVADAIEIVAKMDGDFLGGRRVLNITHLDQFSDYYEFDTHPEIFAILLKICPRLESLKFYISDEGCVALSRIPNVRHLQLEIDDVGRGFGILINQFSSLQTLQLTFRSMSYLTLKAIADNCPLLSVLRLIGFQVEDFMRLVSRPRQFENLKTIDMRMVRQSDPFEEDDYQAETSDTISPQLIHYLLDSSIHLEDLVIQAHAQFLNQDFLMDIFHKNPMTHLQKLKLSVTPSESLNMNTAKIMIEMLPSIQVLGVSRWNISGKEFRELSSMVKKNNLDLAFA